MPFLLPEQVIGDVNANGIVGLAPGNEKSSLVAHLFDQGQMQSLKVGMNIEYPKDKKSVSTMTLGSFDFNQVEGGENGLN